MRHHDHGSPAKPLAGRRVLVVEDEFLLAEEIGSLVEHLGGEVIGPAASPAAALELLGKQPDIALLDINLGGQRVYPVAQALREAAIPFAFTSGYGRSLIDARFNNAPHLDKPFSLQTLHGVLTRLLDRG